MLGLIDEDAAGIKAAVAAAPTYLVCLDELRVDTR
jgi:hypothetical protein